MRLMTGRMMDVFDEVDHFIVCVTSSLRSDGSANMNSSVAAELKDKLENVHYFIGGYIQQKCGSCGKYLLRAQTKVGIFQHGYVPRDTPNLELVSAAAKELKALAEANPDKTYALESPASSKEFWLVEGILRSLPENVTVWLPTT